MSRKRRAPHAGDPVLSPEVRRLVRQNGPPFTRVEAMFNLALRVVVPLIGVLFLGYDGKRFAALYFIDTWLALASLCGLVMFQFLPVGRDRDTHWADLVNGYAGLLLGGLFASSVIMVAAGFPMLLIFDRADLRALAGDTGFLLTLGSHAASATLAFVLQNLRTRVDETTRERLRHRFEFVFLRWIAVYVVVLAATGIGGGPDGRLLAIVMVVAYSLLTIVAEIYPEETRRLIADSFAKGRVPRDGGEK